MSNYILNSYYFVDNGTWLCDQAIIFQSQDNFLSKFMQRYNFTNNEPRNKKVKKIE